MIYHEQNNETVRQSLRLGNVILLSGDQSTSLLANYILDGLLNTVNCLTIYSSEEDSVLGASNWIFGRRRLGQMTTEYMKKSSMIVREALIQEKRIRVIDASKAVGVDSGKGHQYFRSSPWVSSDILMTLMYDLPPEKRGLVRSDGPVWEFPKDYISRLKLSFEQADQERKIKDLQPETSTNNENENP
ncbi:alpha/beta hydrolase [Desulfopila sp. IMCC35008]|uniref:alpha/beta hydrolase n=1 Tax=Desulfopila sp. IMCC35008 TaxID=2653858 RepID=UPI001F0F3786|nr:alpha/beta hydrolase [Desulfopila sp. IMCC35008]